MMNYEETIQYLYDSVPMFQKVGASAYKEGLYNTKELDRHFGHPPRRPPHSRDLRRKVADKGKVLCTR